MSVVGIIGGVQDSWKVWIIGCHGKNEEWCLIECNMTRENDFVGWEIETSISPMLGWITEEDTQGVHRGASLWGGVIYG